MPEPTKTCTKCGETKPLAAYGLHPNTRDGYRTSCKPCNSKQTRQWAIANPEKVKEWVRLNPEKRYAQQRRWGYKRRYGITVADYDRMFTEQGGKCAICRGDSCYENLAVDHDHKTGAIRGLLCQNCNAGIGNLKDDPLVLEAAIAYLRRFMEDT